MEFDPYRASCTQTTFTVDVLTSTQFYDVEINGSQSCGVSAVLTTAAGDTLDAAHDFIHTNGYLNGMWELKNDLYIGASSDGGLGQIIFNSTVGQQYSVNAAAPRTCTIVIDKTAGAVTPAGGTTDFSMQAFILNQGSFTAPTGTMKIGGTFSANTTLFTHTAGTFTHNNGEVEFDPYRASCTQTTFTVDVLTSTQFYDVEINGSQSCGVSAVLTTAAGDTLDAAHDFIHTNGYLNGMWELKNDLYIGASSDGGLGQIIFNSTVGQQYSVNAAAPRTCTIVIDKTAGAVTPAGGTTDFSMQAFILNQGSFTAPTGTMKIGGTFSANTTLFTHTAGTFTHNNGEVEFDPYRASCTQTTFTVDVLTSTQFYDVEINGSQSCGVSAVLTTAAGDSLHVSNLLTLTNGLFNTTYLEAYGNVTVVSTWDGGSGTLIFAGGNAQSFDLTGATTQFNGDIVIDKTSNSVALLSNLQMDAGTGFDLYLNKGHLITTSTEMLIIGDNVKTFNSSDSSFVQGIMRKIGNDAFTFPVGKNDTAYAPITISAPSLTTDHFTAEYFQVDPNTPGYNTSSKDLSLDHLSQCEYWILDRTNGTSNVSVTLSWDDRSCGVTNLSDLAVARWDGAQWKDHGNGGTTGSTANGTVVSNVAISAFSPFTLASSTSQNPLPIELLYFSANLNSENIVDLYWSTASEINNDYFQIERSADGLNWENISLIDGAGNSSVVSNYSAKDVEPLDGISYYRLKQVDFDGEFSYSNIVSVQLRNNNTVNIYPNPTTDFVFINYGQEVETLEIYNSIGQNVTSTIASITENNGIYSISLKNLAPGAYYVKTSTTANIVYKQ
ncbi:MAG: T9SS type A sorting domain-containing protein [Flavobacteriales bacterium]|nr:T9SS type A sorting domain-containing protein [Flavobacteriales bacterium]